MALSNIYIFYQYKITCKQTVCKLFTLYTNIYCRETSLKPVLKYSVIITPSQLFSAKVNLFSLFFLKEKKQQMIICFLQPSEQTVCHFFLLATYFQSLLSFCIFLSLSLYSKSLFFFFNLFLSIPPLFLLLFLSLFIYLISQFPFL